MPTKPSSVPTATGGSYLNAATYEYHAAKYGLFVGGTEVTSANAADVLGNGTVSYDPDSQTLTLNNATITNVNTAGCSIGVDPGATLPLTVALEGTNSCGSHHDPKRHHHNLRFW